MPHHRTLLHWLLILSFALGQCAAVVHASQHELAAHPATAHCALCAFAHAAPVAPATPTLGTVSCRYTAHDSVTASVPPHRNGVVLPPTRGPPAFPA